MARSAASPLSCIDPINVGPPSQTATIATTPMTIPASTAWLATRTAVFRSPAPTNRAIIAVPPIATAENKLGISHST